MAIERYYQVESDACAVDDVKAARVKAIKQSIKKERRRIDAWEGDLLKMSAYQGYARYGELVKANLSSIRKGMDQVTLIDYFDPSMPEISIPLDEAMSARGNMDEYFRKHRKYETAEREIRPRIQRAQRLLADLRRELSAIEEGTWAAPSSDFGRQPKHVASRTFKQRRAQSEPFRRFISADGLPILVGRNARENDDLTFGLARSDDLWLHARGIPGSHVIVRLDKGKDVPAETLQDAATLALCYSDLRKSGKGEVIYTKRKWVKKAKGQAPGAVTVTQERSLNVNLDKARLEALKSRNTQIP
ncbi:hypothetical protein W02_15220 [Nitrospira sp. KM1]|uniref:NFACT RNA binding domain-containing protein n=1 Tax=Nitrospira sp. KM1 TaxID=1936990 RepID=UPI0013A763E6|nr:NFACT RNA binding domain-containing protein [Nitrospira sp. KM1]BCA54382.1 hypothetical protein W02_15220 [Nitrospira sp. KM1]